MILKLKKENFALCENNIAEYGINLTIKKWFGCEQVYGEKYLKIKPNLYGGKINTNFHDNGKSWKTRYIYRNIS